MNQHLVTHTHTHTHILLILLCSFGLSPFGSVVIHYYIISTVDVLTENVQARSGLMASQHGACSMTERGGEFGFFTPQNKTQWPHGFLAIKPSRSKNRDVRLVQKKVIILDFKIDVWDTKLHDET